MCGGPRQFVGVRAYLNQWGIAMRVTWTSLFSNMALVDSAPRLNSVSRDKKSASVWQADVPTNFSPIQPRQNICSSATKNRLVCGSLNREHKRFERAKVNCRCFHWFPATMLESLRPQTGSNMASPLFSTKDCNFHWYLLPNNSSSEYRTSPKLWHVVYWLLLYDIWIS